MPENILRTEQYNASQGNGQFAVGRAIFDATAIVATDFVEIKVGFKPSYISWQNLTDRVGIEFYEGMTANNCLKTAATGVRTLETVGITLTDSGFRVLQNAALGAILASKTCFWQAKA